MTMIIIIIDQNLLVGCHYNADNDNDSDDDDGDNDDDNDDNDHHDDRDY